MGTSSLRSELDAHLAVQQQLGELSIFPEARPILELGAEMFELGMRLGVAVVVRRLRTRLEEMESADEIPGLLDELQADLTELTGDES